MFKTPFSFEGRIRRTEFGLSYIIYIVAAGIISALMEISEATSFLGLGFIPVIWFLIAQGAKRCHDRGNSGWYQLIPSMFFGCFLQTAILDKMNMVPIRKVLETQMKLTK